MELRQLEYFVAVAAEESVTEAAHVLRVSQSSVSTGLKSLERELGVVLFDRTTRSLSITDVGQRMLPEAREVLDRLERLRSLAGQSASGITGNLRMGSFSAMEQFGRLPEILTQFRAAYPCVDVSIRASRTGSTGLTEDLLRGRLDLAFSALPGTTEIETVELTSAPYVLVVPTGHRLAARESVALAELEGEEWVDVVEGYGNRIQVEHTLHERGMTRRVTAEVTSLPSIPGFVAAGAGVAVIPDLVATTGCAKVHLLDAVPRWRLSLAMRRGARRRPQIAAFTAIVEQVFRGPVPAVTGSARPARPAQHTELFGSADD
ncbi:MAG TPA: LysR family transcriptional regulator [Cellulomonas sp.]